MKQEEIEKLLENYDENEDELEIRASRENYERESATLLELIEKREETVKLLKLATKERTAQVREVIAELDELIERTEQIVAMQYDLYLQRIDLLKQYIEAAEMTEKIQPELLQYLAENNPEAYEQLKAQLEDDGKTH